MSIRLKMTNKKRGPQKTIRHDLNASIDTQLTVRENLLIYARLKGLGKLAGHDVEALMEATTLAQYGDRLASQLSGGNQRKLALAIALIGRSPKRVH